MLFKKNNEVFLGEFLNDEFHKGIFNLNNGEIYEGEFKDNEFNGDGTYKFNCQDIYRGSF
jgi:hypothetical protein